MRSERVPWKRKGASVPRVGHLASLCGAGAGCPACGVGRSRARIWGSPAVQVGGPLRFEIVRCLNLEPAGLLPPDRASFEAAFPDRVPGVWVGIHLCRFPETGNLSDT